MYLWITRDRESSFEPSAGEYAPAPPDDAGVSGGHQNGGCLLREPAAGEHPPAAAGGAKEPDPGFPGAGSA